MIFISRTKSFFFSFFTKIKFSFDDFESKRSKQIFLYGICIIRPRRAEEITEKKENVRIYVICKNKSYVQDAYASYSIESRVKVIPRYVELPCERILLDPPPRIRLEKENFTANFSIEIENLQLRDLFQIKFLSYPLEKKKKSNFHNKKKRGRKLKLYREKFS